MDIVRKNTKNIMIVMVMMTISRLLGFFREIATANIFGRGMATDAFFAAFTIPDMMYYLLIGGALSAAFIPVFTSYLAVEDEQEAWKVASTFINIIIVLLFILSIAGMVFARQIVPLVAYGFRGDQLTLTANLTRFMFPSVAFTALAGLTTGVLQSYKRFNASTVGPILYNVGIILGALLLGSIWGITGMAVGVLTGALTNFLYQFLFIRDKIVFYRPVFYFSHPGVKQIFLLMLPVLVGLSITQINLIINQNLASGLMTGSITALRLANRLMQLPLGIFAMSISTVIFPTITAQIAREEYENFRISFSKALSTIFYITIPSAVGLMVIGLPLLRVLFVHGAFKVQDAIITAQALFFYSFGLVAQAGIQLLTRGFYAKRDTSTPVKIGVITVMINIIVSLYLVKCTNFGVRGPALAYSFSSFINMILLFIYLQKRMNGIYGKKILVSGMKAGIAAAVMGIVIYLSTHMLVKLHLFGGAFQDLITLILGCILGGSIYFGLTILFRMEEVKSIFSLIKEKSK